MKKVIIANYTFTNVDIEKKILEEAGFCVATYPEISSKDEFVSIAKDADAILSEKGIIDKYIIDKLEKCKVILRYGIGYDEIDVKTANDNKIKVIHIPDYCKEEVSDHVMALLLSSIRHIPILNNNIRTGIWEFKQVQPAYRILGKTFGFIGFGNIAQRVSEKVKAWDLNLIAYDPYLKPEIAEKYNVKLVSLMEVIQQSDYITIHVPLNKGTEGLIGKNELKAMKNTAILINASRGRIVDEQALAKALKEGEIHAAALDTFAFEPIEEDNPLLELDNVILTPHYAYYSETSLKELHTKAGLYTTRALNGEVFNEIVNKKEFI